MPIIKKDSIKFIKLAWSFLLDVTIPMVANTETLINAKLAPTTAKRTFVMAKLPNDGISKHAVVTNANASNIERLYPIRVM